MQSLLRSLVLASCLLLTRFAFSQETATSVRIGGFVRTPTGAPVEGASVAINGVVRDDVGQWILEPCGKLVTDREGRWSCEIPSTITSYNFKVAHREYFPAEYDQLADEKLVTGHLSQAELRSGQAVLILQPGIVVSGTLCDREGNPIPNGTVALAPSGKENKIQSACDTAGRFRVVLLEQGEFDVIAQAQGYAPELQTTTIEAGIEPIQFSLNKAKPLRGRVQEKTGEPIAGAAVRLVSWRNSRLLGWQTETDRSGQFEWDSAPESGATFRISRADYRSIAHRELTPGETEVALVLQRSLRISGTAVDADTQEPIPQFSVTRGRSAGPDEPPLWERGAEIQGRDGRYSASFGDPFFQARVHLLIEAPGYMPAESASEATDGWLTRDFQLKKSKGIDGLVETSQGQPARRATVILADDQSRALMTREGIVRPEGYRSARAVTDAQGRFELPPRLHPRSVIIAHETGYAEVSVNQLGAHRTITLKPWGRIKGQVRFSDSSRANRTVWLSNPPFSEASAGRRTPGLALNLETSIAADGSFSFDQVPSGERQVSLRYNFGSRQTVLPLSHGQCVAVRPGETTEVVIGGGRMIVGRVKIASGDPEEVDWKRGVQYLISITSPGSRARVGGEGKYALIFDEEGAFQVESVPPGRYTITISPSEASDFAGEGSPLGSVSKEVEIPAGDAPFDLGTLDLELRKTLKIGAAAPELDAQTVDGKPLNLAQFRGKYVLLSLWLGAPPQTNDLPFLKIVSDLYSQDPRLRMLSLTSDLTEDLLRGYVRQNELDWPQGILPPAARNPAVEPYFHSPAIYLIDPDGKLVARNLPGPVVQSVVDRFLRYGNARPGTMSR